MVVLLSYHRRTPHHRSKSDWHLSKRSSGIGKLTKRYVCHDQ